jgi:PAS domain S-box-containing protein
LLPARWMSRLVVAAAVLLALLLVLDIELVRSSAAKLLASNCLDVAMVLLAASCSFYAARRSSGYARQLWLLLGVALTLETLGQAISTYYQSFVPGAAQTPWPSDVLFFVWAAPVFMIFLPLSEEDSSGIDFLRLLDFLQLAILAVTFYLYFFYSPSRWQANQPALLRQILIVYLSRDLILSIGFSFRARSSIPSWLRTFCLVLSVAFLLLVVADAEYLFAIVDSRISASWGDLIWMIPSIIVVVFAVKWRPPVSMPVSSSPSRVAALLNAQILPILIPLLVIFMGRAIAQEQTLLAWIAVSASVLCSSVRLILTNRRQRRVADNLLDTERALRSSEEILSTAFFNSPDAFSINPFPNGGYLEVNDGFTRLTGYTREEVLGKTPREMNLWVDFDRRDEALALLNRSANLRDFEFRFRTKSGQIRFGQMSASIIDIHGQRCTLVIVRDTTERKEAEDILRSSEERFRSLVRDLHFAVVLHTPEANVEFANRAAHRMFNIPDGTAVGKHLTDLGVYAIGEDGKPLPFADHPVPYVLRTQTPIHDGLVAFRRPSSDCILWIFGSAVPQFDSSGNLIRVISSFADVTEMKNAERAIHNLSTQLLKLQDEERRRLGRELHDGLAQTVLAINLSLAQVRQSLTSQEEAAARSLEKARALTQQMSREIRTLSYLLHPPLLDDLGLVSTLREYVHGFSERSGIETRLFAMTDFARLPQPIEIALFRIVQESLANIQRHSGSSTAEIHLTTQDSLLTLDVTDHGHGIRPPAPESRRRTASVHAELRNAVPAENANAPTSDGNGIEHFQAATSEVRDVEEREGTALVRAELRSAVPSSDALAEASAPEGNGQNAEPYTHSTFTTFPSESIRLGVGIPGMRERMAQLGGNLEIFSGSSGTTIRATISLPVTEPRDASSTHPDRR